MTKTVKRPRGNSVTAASHAPKLERLAYKVGDAANVLGISVTAAYELINKGQLRYVRLAKGGMLIPRQAIDQYLAGDTSEAVAR